MSKERELLKAIVLKADGVEGIGLSLIIKESKELLAQPEQEPVAWQFRTFHGEDTVCSGWDVWEDCTELKFNNVSEYVTNGFYQVRKLYTSPTTREPLREVVIVKLFGDHTIAIHADSYWAGIEDAEKAHGIGE